MFQALEHEGRLPQKTSLPLNLSLLTSRNSNVSKYRTSTPITQLHDVQGKMKQKCIELRLLSTHDPCEVIYEDKKPSLVNQSVTNLSCHMELRFDYVKPLAQSVQSRKLPIRKRKDEEVDKALIQALDLVNRDDRVRIPTRLCDQSTDYSFFHSHRRMKITKTAQSSIPQAVALRLKVMHDEGKKGYKWSPETAH